MTGSNTCPNGTGFPELLHLTVPNNMNFVQSMGVFFSMLPVALMVFFFFVFVFTRKLQFIVLFSLGCLASAVNQFILKPLKEEARPDDSCLKDTDGFPSGHSVNAMGVWAFLVLQEAFNYRASISRRVILCLIYTSVFILNGPARDVVKDHTWTQIGVGMGAGVIWGAVVWLFFRFIFNRWLLEKLMTTKFASWLSLRNDLDPDYRWSKYQGTRAGHSEEKKFNETQSLLTEGSFYDKRRTQVVSMHIVSVVIQMLLGITAIPIAFYPRSSCSLVAEGLLISIGSFTIGIGACQAVVTLLIYRKLTDRRWYALVLKGAMMLAGTLFFQSLFYEYLIVDSSRKNGCLEGGLDRATIYAIVWAIVEAIMVIIWLGMCKVFRIPSLYSNKLALPGQYYISANRNLGYASI